MKARGTFVIAAAAFLLGVALPTLILWNPWGWAWADRWVGRQRPEAHLQSRRESGKQLWTCGMHLQVLQDKPGNCPICGMKLVPVRGSGEASTVSKQGKIKYWRAPMDPNYVSDKPGKSPMGMDLIPVYEDDVAAESGVRVDPNFLQNFAVRTVRVERGSIPLEIRTVGTIGYNEKNIVSVNTKFEGWIEGARVNYIAQPVKRGDVLFEIYSPQLVTTQQEYLAAIEYLRKLSEGGSPEAIDRARSLLNATRERLHYWDITEEQIDELIKTKRVSRTLKILAPVSGVIIEKMGNSLEGMKLNPGMNIYKIADLSTVWASIEVFEYQIQYLRLGQMAHISLEAFPGRHWSGRVIYLDPALNPQTRSLKASVEIANPDGKLRPEMYADTVIRIPEVSHVVRVPSESVLHSGERNVVIVQKAPGLFEPREVELGDEGGGYQEIRRGLSAGETVVTSSQFLIDSESNLKEAISKMLAARQSNADETAKPEVPLHQH